MLLAFSLLVMPLTGKADPMTLGDVNRDGQVDVADMMMVADIILNGCRPLTLSDEKVMVERGSSTTVEISSGYGTYRVSCPDSLQVEVSLDGTSLMIMGKEAGHACVTVTDAASGLQKVIDVTVNASQMAYLSCPDDRHPHLIDLGLPSGTKWACCNVDPDPAAQSPANCGGYYAWGETEVKVVYNWDSYAHYNGAEGACRDIGNDISGSPYDVAHVKWGGAWVMPSYAQVMELMDNCPSKWSMLDGVEGRVFTGSNGGSIFLPAAGFRWFDDLNEMGLFGHYWSSTRFPSAVGDAYGLDFDSGGLYWGEYGGRRDNGQNVRPVAR